MPAAIRIDLCSTAEVAPGNALKVDKAGFVLGFFGWRFWLCRKLKFARLRLDLSGCFTPRGHSIKAQNVIENGAAPLAQPARGTHDGR